MFSKLDLRHGYYQVSIEKGKEKKNVILTRYGSFEFLVMPFQLCSATATFCTLMNDVLHPYLDSFVVVYLKDIMIFNDNMEDHKNHLDLVFEALKKNSCTLRSRNVCSPRPDYVPWTHSRSRSHMDGAE